MTMTENQQILDFLIEFDTSYLTKMVLKTDEDLLTTLPLNVLPKKFTAIHGAVDQVSENVNLEIETIENW
uniref:Uncharacterized protein n=1 Tax=Glossina palpalis gambiensis TaxID=67801 RepID=A0A1B0BZS6_9MUSC